MRDPKINKIEKPKKKKTFYVFTCFVSHNDVQSMWSWMNSNETPTEQKSCALSNEININKYLR